MRLRLKGVLVAALVLLAVVAAPVGAAFAAPSLTATERRALSVASITAAADPSIGVVINAAFNGDIEQLLGQGGLRGGALTVAVSGAPGTAVSGGVVDTGGGFTVEQFPTLARSGGRAVVRRRAIRLFSPERIQSMTPRSQVLALRVGNRVIVGITGVPPSQMANVRLEASASGAPARSAGGQTAAHVAAVGSAAIGSSHATVAQLQALQSTLTRALNRGLQPELRQERAARTELAGAIRDGRALSRLARVNAAALIGLSKRSATAVAGLQAKITTLEQLRAHVTTLLEASLHPSVTLVQTDPGLSERMATEPPLALSTLMPRGVPVITVDEGTRYQRFAGVGAALTDSAAWLIESALPDTVRLALLQALFGEPGSQNALAAPAIHLSSLRLALGSSGAMTLGAPYSYDDLPSGQSDPGLASFSIAHDLAYIIPAVKQALAINPQLQILGSPWSPPAWMKTNDSLDNPDGQGRLLPSAFSTFATYLVRSIEAYAAAGVPIAAITPQNEPSSGQLGTAYPGLTLTEADEAQLITDDLAPALRAAGLDTRIYGGDLSWDALAYAEGLTTSSLNGIAWHCYYGSPAAMTALHSEQPGLDQIVDECSPEVRPVGTPEFLISSLRNWASAVSVWTAALDPAGGPIQPGNDCVGCTGPVTIDEQTQSVTFGTEYYQLGQLSAFVAPGAVRIGSPSQVSYGVDGAGYETATVGLDDVAFLNPDGSVVLIADDNSTVPITFGVASDGRYFTATLPPRAMATFVWR